MLYCYMLCIIRVIYNSYILGYMVVYMYKDFDWYSVYIILYILVNIGCMYNIVCHLC